MMSRLYVISGILLFVFIGALALWYNESRPPSLNTNKISTSSPASPPYSNDSAIERLSTTTPTAPKDVSELDLALTGNVSLLLTDSDGQRTGSDPISGHQLQEIPNSVYFEDSVSGEVNRSIQILQPQAGRYQVTLVGLGMASYQFSIRTFSRNGEPQPELVKKGNLPQGSKVNFVLRFTNVPGEVSSIE
jgi:hypothetical protein